MEGQEGNPSEGAQTRERTAQPTGASDMLAPEIVIKGLAGLAAVVALMQFVTYVDWMADVIAWQGHIMFWALFAAGGYLVAVGFLGGQGRGEGGFGTTERLIAVMVALILFALVGSAAGGAFDVPDFSMSF